MVRSGSVRFRVLAVLAVVGLGAGACGGGSDSTANDPTPTPTPATTRDPTPEPTAQPTPEPTPPPTAEPTPESTPEPEPLWHVNLQVGSCFDDPPDFDYGAQVIEPLDCAQIHDNEIYADAAYPADSDDFPGEEGLLTFAAESACADGYEDFTGFAFDDRPIPYFAIVPTEATWDRGDRRVVCSVFEQDGFVGTVTSAGLAAPTLALLHLFDDGQVDLWITRQGQRPFRVTDDVNREAPQPPSLAPSGLAYYARYPVDDTSEADIYELDFEAAVIKPILATTANEDNPQVSPDGTRILYQSDAGGGEFDVWVMGIDGSNQTQLTDNPDRDANASWSPDGSRIVYRARVDGNSDIWIMDADGSNPQRLTDDPGGDYDPVFSPDGSKIVFTSDRSGNFDIWVMEPDGSNPTNLTNHPAADEYPQWTGDGLGIVFTSDRIAQAIWVMRADGSDQTMFTTSFPSGYALADGPLG